MAVELHKQYNLPEIRRVEAPEYESQNFTSTPNLMQTAKSIVVGKDIEINPNQGIAIQKGSIYAIRRPLTDGATITVDWRSGNTHSVTLAGNRTIAWVNQADGQVIVIAVKQDATGTRTITWPATVAWPGGTAPTLTTTASKTDVFAFVRHAADNKEYGQTVGLNY